MLILESVTKTGDEDCVDLRSISVAQYHMQFIYISSLLRLCRLNM